MSGQPPGSGDPAAQLLACYRRVAAATAALRHALDADDLERLDTLADERAALIAEATALLERSAARGADNSATGTSYEWKAVLAAGRRAMEEDEHLRARLASRAQEIPETLASLRASRGVLQDYGGGTPSPDSVDRRA